MTTIAPSSQRGHWDLMRQGDQQRVIWQVISDAWGLTSVVMPKVMHRSAVMLRVTHRSAVMPRVKHRSAVMPRSLGGSAVMPRVTGQQ